MKTMILCATLVAASAGIAQTSPEAPATQRTGVINDPDEIVCVRENVIGSRLTSRRVCRTRAEWATAREQVKQVVERVQQQMQTQY